MILSLPKPTMLNYYFLIIEKVHLTRQFMLRVLMVFINYRYNLESDFTSAVIVQVQAPVSMFQLLVGV